VNEQARPSIPHLAAGAAAGLAVALAIGWWLAPAQLANSDPSALHPDYRDEYVLMIAAAYEVEQDIELVKERLLLLNPESVADPLLELAERRAQAGNDEEEVARLARLAWVLGETTPLLVPYLEDGS
jgi:hypothetical protein